MEIIAHRGYWLSTEEKNTLISFERALLNGFGIETDIRDYDKKLVISHDIPVGNEISVEEFFEFYNSCKVTTTLALNIKADGLQRELKKLIDQYKIEKYFCFDMSIPDTLGYINNGINVFSRSSEYEKEFPFYQSSTGLWLDCFNSDCITNDSILNHLKNNKKVCIVSSELHKRAYKETWQQYREVNTEHVMLCTDYPQEAKEFFNDKN